MLFRAQSVFDFTEFEKICPQPKPPVVVMSGVKSENFDHPKYKARIREWATRKGSWTILKSLEATPFLEWELVDPLKPETWHLYAEELREILMPNEVAEVESAVMIACALTSDKIEEATQSFLHGAGPDLLNVSSPTTEHTTTPDSEPASASI
jgi:hypothetical protein